MCQTIGTPLPNTRSSGENHFLAIFRRPTFKFSLFTLKIRIFKEPWFGRRHSVFISALGFVHYHPIGQAPTLIPAVSSLNRSHRSGGTKRRGFRAHCGPRQRHDIWRRISRLEIVSLEAWDGGVATGLSSTLRNISDGAKSSLCGPILLVYGCCILQMPPVSPQSMVVSPNGHHQLSLASISSYLLGCILLRTRGHSPLPGEICLVGGFQ